MRKTLVIALLSLALPIACWANGIDFTNKGGTLQISGSGIISKGAVLHSYAGIVAPTGHNLGSVSYTTGALISGSLAAGGTFSSTGSSFLVIGKGNYGQPKGVIFNGAFVGNITWTYLGKINGVQQYQLTGQISGQLYNGRTVTGTTTQTYWTTKSQLAKGIVHGMSGTTNIVGAVPEPGTLGLLGTGLIACAGVVRRKLIRH